MTGSIKRYYDKIYRGGMDNLIKGLTGRIDSGKGSFVVTANPEIFMMGKCYEDMNEALLDENTFIVPDGIGVIKGGEIFGARFKERIPGVEICGELLKYADRFRRLKESIREFCLWDIQTDMWKIRIPYFGRLRKWSRISCLWRWGHQLRNFLSIDIIGRTDRDFIWGSGEVLMF